MEIGKNKNFKDEYCASVVKIGEILPIEGRDRIAKTLVNGLSIVIGKTEFKTGDVAVYVSNECVIHELFLHLNNMYDDKELNADKEARGYINNKGRVRVVKLGGVPSYGILLNPASIATFLNEPVDSVVSFLEEHAGEDFDEINGERFCHVYVPEVKNGHGQQLSKADRRAKKLARFKMLIDGSFRFHYDTKGLEKYIDCIAPDDEVDISTKLHGTSGIFSNILTNVPTPWYKRVWRKYVTKKDVYDQAYNIVYSSRTVIKNEYINKKQRVGGYYSDDIWGYWAQKLKGLIPEDVCIYCEIVGYTPNGSPIQKGYDYGCDANATEKSKMMVYRVTKNGKELEISDVIAFGAELKEALGDLIIEYPLLYHGTLANLHPELDVRNHWNENIIEAMKNEKDWLMEKDEPMCNNKVPREGVVLRKCNDPVAEAWKLKCFNFLQRERKAYDNEEVDMEAMEGYGDEA